VSGKGKTLGPAWEAAGDCSDWAESPRKRGTPPTIKARGSGQRGQTGNNPRCFEIGQGAAGIFQETRTHHRISSTRRAPPRNAGKGGDFGFLAYDLGRFGSA